MSRTKFDPYGETLELADGAGAGSTSRWLTRFGAGLFWALVVAIVGARVIYFDPAMLEGVRQAVVLLEGLIKIL